jgi:CubicO group peptidase (beta-lactamase class C family)
LLLNEVRKNKTPSIQYYFFSDTDVLFSYRYGFADIANKITVTENTSYNAFSVTKTFTAMAILQLQEKKLLKFPSVPQQSLKPDIIN